MSLGVLSGKFTSEIVLGCSAVELGSGVEQCCSTPQPKNSRKELFNRARELELLDESAARGDPLIVVTEIRRIRKAFLLLSFLEEWNGFYMDMRG